MLREVLMGGFDWGSFFLDGSVGGVDFFKKDIHVTWRVLVGGICW